MFYYQMLYPMVLQPSVAVPQTNSMAVMQNYVHVFQNSQFCYNGNFILGVQELLPQGNFGLLGQKGQLWAHTQRQGEMAVEEPIPKSNKNAQKCYNEENQWKSNGATNLLSQNSPSFNKPSQKYQLNCTKSNSLRLEDSQKYNPNPTPNLDQSPQNPNNYPKKNTESNVVNQIFSFISTESKSLPTVRRYLKQDKKKIASFYQILKAIKKRKKKYINRKYLCTLCTIKQKDIGYKMLLRARNKMNVLSVPEFQKILSVLIVHYLRDESEINIITSKKINKFTFLEHLERRREIREYLVRKFVESTGRDCGDGEDEDEDEEGEGEDREGDEEISEN